MSTARPPPAVTVERASNPPRALRRVRAAPRTTCDGHWHCRPLSSFPLLVTCRAAPSPGRGSLINALSGRSGELPERQLAPSPKSASALSAALPPAAELPAGAKEVEEAGGAAATTQTVQARGAKILAPAATTTHCTSATLGHVVPVSLPRPRRPRSQVRSVNILEPQKAGVCSLFRKGVSRNEGVATGGLRRVDSSVGQACVTDLSSLSSLLPNALSADAPSAAASPSPRRPRKLTGGRVVLLVGWQRHLGQLLRALDARLPPNSLLWVLSEKSKEWRRTELASEGLALDGDALRDPQPIHGHLSQKGGLREALVKGPPRPPNQSVSSDSVGASPQVNATAAPTPPPHMLLPGREESGSGGAAARAKLPKRSRPKATEGALKNCKIQHMVGFTTDEEALYRLLRAAPADAAIVQADVDDHVPVSRIPTETDSN